MEFVVLLFITIFLSYIFNNIFKKIRVPALMGSILVGILFFIFKKEMIVSNIPILSMFEELGIMLFLFYIGYKIDLDEIHSSSKFSVVLSFFSILFSFIAGFLVIFYFTKDVKSSFIAGFASTITAEIVLAFSLKQFNLLKTRVGHLVMNMGIINDITHIIFFACLGGLLTGKNGFFLGVIFTFVAILVFILIFALVKKYLIPLLFKTLNKNPDASDLFSVSLIIIFFLASAAQILNISIELGAISAGILFKELQKKDKTKMEEKTEEYISIFTFGFLKHIVYMMIGFQIMRSLPHLNVFLALSLLIFVTLGNIVGSALGLFFEKRKLNINRIHESIIIGVGATTKGGLELIALEIARKSALVSLEVYSSFALVSLISAFLMPFLFTHLIKWYYGTKMDLLDSDLR